MAGDAMLQDSLTDSDVERVVGALRAVEHDCAWKRVLTVGRVVFEALGGDEPTWRSRRGKRNVSLRRLVEHPGCPFKKTALSDAVNVHLFVKRNPAVLDLTPLTPTHVMRVVCMPSDVALSLLQACVQNSWSVRHLLCEVRALRKQSGDRRGRPASSLEQRAETSARRAIVALQAMRDQLKGSDNYSPALVASLDEMQELIAEIRALPHLRHRSGVVLTLAKPASAGQREEIAG